MADESGQTHAINGTYQVVADGLFTMNVGAGKGFHGFINASKNVVAMNPVDLVTFAGDNESRMVVLSRRAGKYTADMISGTWTIAADSAIGTLTFGGGGKLRGSLAEDSSGSVAFSGSYVVSSAGTLSATIVIKNKQGTHIRNLRG